MGRPKWWPDLTLPGRLEINRDLRNTCVSAQKIFKEFWYFICCLLCRNLNEKSLIYTFNPYANIFPKFWTSIQTNILLLLYEFDIA